MGTCCPPLFPSTARGNCDKQAGRRQQAGVQFHKGGRGRGLDCQLRSRARDPTQMFTYFHITQFNNLLCQFNTLPNGNANSKSETLLCTGSCTAPPPHTHLLKVRFTPGPQRPKECQDSHMGNYCLSRNGVVILRAPVLRGHGSVQAWSTLSGSSIQMVPPGGRALRSKG